MVGGLRHFDMIVGSVHPTMGFGDLEIVSYNSAIDITVKFRNTGAIRARIPASRIRKGAVADLYSPTVVGLGYQGDGLYPARKHRLLYWRWAHMFYKIHKPIHKADIDNYWDCSIDPRWYNFQNYAEWFYQQYTYGDEVYHVDKDLKFYGNRVYGPDTCLLIPMCLNVLIASTSVSNRLGTGVSQRGKKYIARYTFNGVRETIYSLSSAQEAASIFTKFHYKAVFNLAERLYLERRIDGDVYEIIKDRYQL